MPGPAPLTLLASGGEQSAVLAAGLAAPVGEQATALDAERTEPTTADDGDSRDPTLPRYRLSDIRKHDSSSAEPWVTSGDKVYDITEWVSAHPGGDVILRAAGGSIDPYWDIFSIHKAPHVYEILSQYLIGYIDAADLVGGKPAAESVEDPFEADPARDARLVTHTLKPRNAEPPSAELARDFLTPNELFYVRNHMWVPAVTDAAAHQLAVELPDGEVRTYTLDELRCRFRTHKVTAALQCSGNRRNDMTRHAGKTNGLQWGVGAISNAEWEGVRLSDVLADAGLRTTDPAIATVTSSSSSSSADAAAADPEPGSGKLHVQFSGLEAYGASIPLSVALDPRADVLLAFAMNGQPLPRDHGFPLRAVVPGHVAARSVKWLSRVVVADEESPSQWQRRDYKCFGPNEGDRPDWDRYPAIQQMPVTSAITKVWVGDCVRRASSRHPWMLAPASSSFSSRAAPGVRDLAAWQAAHLPPSRAAAAAEPVALTGYAYSGGGRAIIRVDVSVDGGRTWDQAELLRDCEDVGDRPCRGNKAWAWTRWRYAGTLPQFTSPANPPPPPSGDSAQHAAADEQDRENKDQGKAACTEILVKATDDAYNTQPEQHAGIYNVRGNLATAWHRLRVCPSCVTGPDGQRRWSTGDAVFGCGFAEESQEVVNGSAEAGKEKRA